MLDLIQAGLQAFDTAFNVFNQNQNRQDMMALQQKAWNRDDTAIQRRVADLKAAGLSPVLAAGQGASNSAPIRLEPVQSNVGKVADKFIEGSMAQMMLMRQKAEIDNTIAQNKLIQMQAEKVKADTDATRQTMGFQQQTIPLEIIRRQMDIQFDQEMNPNRVKQLQTQLERQNLDIVGQSLDNQLSQIGIDQRNLELIQQRYRNQLLEQGLTLGQTEIAIKAIALETARLARDKLKTQAEMGGNYQQGLSGWLDVVGNVLDLFKGGR